jgi:hypothetical protein
MSPEQALGQLVDKRSDVFSAASVFYFMITGRAPFGQSDMPSVLDAVVHRQPAVITESEAPEALSRALMKALDKDPDRRYQSFALLGAEIAQVRRSQDSDRHRIARAALERYRQIEALIEERRALGRRLRVENIDRSCDEASARLARRFPVFARYAIDGALAPLDLDAASAALSHLQDRHNAELAKVSVLRAASGDPSGSDRSIRDRAAALLNRLRHDPSKEPS